MDRCSQPRAGDNTNFRSEEIVSRSLLFFFCLWTAYKRAFDILVPEGRFPLQFDPALIERFAEARHEVSQLLLVFAVQARAKMRARCCQVRTRLRTRKGSSGQ